MDKNNYVSFYLPKTFADNLIVGKTYHPYGCDCCNDGDLRSRKKSQRKLAKVRFRRENERLISTLLEKEIGHD